MTEFTNYDTNIHITRYLKDQQQAERFKQQTPESPNGASPFRFTQEPILFKPLIKDIVHGGSYDRVFSKTASYKNDPLRCSGGIVMPSQFLDLMSPKQKAQAMALFEKGLLVVQICSATTYFSKKHKQLKEAKSGHV